MMLWIILTTMTATAAVLVAAPFLRRIDAGETGAAHELVVYRDQLQEIEREARDALIDPAQAEAARQEIMRRALLADRAARPAPKPAPIAVNNVATVAVCAIVVLGSVGLYALNGRPDLDTSTYTNRANRPGGLLATLKAEGEQASGVAGGSGPSASLATVEEMIDRLSLRLQLQPADAEGWRMLGWSNFSTERYPEAVEAYARAVALEPTMPLLQSSYGEAIVRANSGSVTPLAKSVFETSLQLAPKDPRARFFDGLAKLQEGRKSAALDAWLALLADAGPEDDWAPDLEQRVAELGKDIGVDPAARRTPSTAPVTADARSPATAPPVQTDQQSLMIRGMVDGLASRLAVSPRDEEGWIKLIRSYKVLGEYNASRAALRRALEVFGEPSPEHARIAEAAQAMGIYQ